MEAELESLQNRVAELEMKWARFAGWEMMATQLLRASEILRRDMQVLAENMKLEGQVQQSGGSL